MRKPHPPAWAGWPIAGSRGAHSMRRPRALRFPRSDRRKFFWNYFPPARKAFRENRSTTVSNRQSRPIPCDRRSAHTSALASPAGFRPFVVPMAFSGQRRRPCDAQNRYPRSLAIAYARLVTSADYRGRIPKMLRTARMASAGATKKGQSAEVGGSSLGAYQVIVGIPGGLLADDRYKGSSASAPRDSRLLACCQLDPDFPINCAFPFATAVYLSDLASADQFTRRPK